MYIDKRKPRTLQIWVCSFLFVVTHSFAGANEGPGQTVADDAAISEIVVTATRQSQFISKVPISVSAYTESSLDKEGIKSFADVARITPGVTVDTSNNFISIRGIASGIGASTTGIYIDDTPIQVYGVGAYPNNPLPTIFDLERIEVLRGPQGTLFGAGSEGGSVRYITPQPSLTQYTGYSRAEISFTDGGGLSHEVGAAFGGPIVQNSLGFRVSAYERHDSGWIDRVDPQTNRIIDGDANSGDKVAVRAAVSWAPVENLLITPSILFENLKSDTQSIFYPVLSNPDSGIFRSADRSATPQRDRFYLPSLRVSYSWESVDLIAASSYYRREENFLEDFSSFISALFGLNSPTGANVPGLPNYSAIDHITNNQTGLSQEIRFQSSKPDSVVTWVAGVFWGQNKQFNSELTADPQFPEFTQNVLGAPPDAVYGLGLVDGIYSQKGYYNTKESQTAAFGEVNYKITDKLTLTGGLRIAKADFNFHNNGYGPYNGGSSQGGGSEHEKPITPKASISYQANDENLFYATIAKGYRIGGANQPFSQTLCAADLAILGITQAPASFRSDSVWNYEIGLKNNLFDHRLQIASSIYDIKWSDIQQQVPLRRCGYYYIDNLGAARSRGFDTQIAAHITTSLTLGVAIGYTDARFVKTINAGTFADGSRAVLVSDGDRLAVAPWTVTSTAEYNFRLGTVPAYLHGTYSYAAGVKSPTPGQDPSSVSFDPFTYNTPTNRFFSLRVGLIEHSVDVSIFADNVLNSATVLTLSHEQITSPLFRATGFRPRTIGLTAAYRF